MKRIYHPYHHWEDWQAGMWRHTSGDERKVFLKAAIAFTGDAKQYGAAMQKIIAEWPVSCEHNLTETSMNRLAWIGHAACCYAIQCPEDVTRQAWALLTEDQRIAADAEAQKALDEWQAKHEAKGTQVSLFVAEERLSERRSR